MTNQKALELWCWSLTQAVADLVEVVASLPESSGDGHEARRIRRELEAVRAHLRSLASEVQAK